MSKISHVFFDVSMSNGHKGLTEIMRKHKKAVIKTGELALFINKKFSALKVLTAENVLLHLRKEPNERIDPEAIKYLPHCIEGNTLNYRKALHAAIVARFERGSE